MIYGFDSEDEHAATAALVVYAIWRSRDKRRYKITPDTWGQVERFCKAAAKRARSIPAFIEAMKPRLCCDTISPKWIAVGSLGEIPLVTVSDPESGAISYAIQPSADPDAREFGISVLGKANAAEVMRRLYQETAWVVALVRDRLEREKPIESKFSIEE